ncbi:MAG TPA: twin-arginine translocation signal domain-containing protein [Candidatus Dormibacteraeota bacterium]|nr:twin-arginine translocation signal domain-containing protein [Candidatus Dormibacteraeota bacterium]
MKDAGNVLKSASSRRSFLKKGTAAVGAATAAGLVIPGKLFAQGGDDEDTRLTKGDIAILRLASAAEQIEADLWQQYSELGGTQDDEVSGVNGGNPIYIGALELLDGDMAQYIHDNTDDEISHHAFLNNYLISKGAEPVDLSHFATLPSSQATGAKQVGRLTNLTQLSVDTSWWTRYRSTTNPDLGATFRNALPSLVKGQFTAIPRTNDDLGNSFLSDNNAGSIADRLKAIAFTAGFHFAFIEQGGASLYGALAQQASSLEVLRILISIGGSEIMHFQTWQDKAGNATPLTFTDPVNKSTATFVDLTQNQPEDLQSNLIMPEPCDFLHKSLGPVAIIRPTSRRLGGAVAAIQSFVDDGLFIGQKDKNFAKVVFGLAEEADEARRSL